jgi:porphobilinogen synthase
VEIFQQKDFSLNLSRRLRRNRSNQPWRDLIEETSLSKKNLIYPIFITETATTKIDSMPGIFRYHLSDALLHLKEVEASGIQAIILFCHVDSSKKDAIGSEVFREESIFSRAIEAIKNSFPSLLLIVDIALDPYTDHGFDGVINEKGIVKNDPSVELLGQMALLAALKGADIVAPSDMMDGRIGHIRHELDKALYHDIGIMSYAVKFHTHLYAPFREALDSSPKKGDKKNFQVNCANKREALLECLFDEEEGADLLLIKPGLPSLDIISTLRRETLIPIGAYQVSGEYSMIMAASRLGWIQKEQIFLESLLCMRRAGADFIITYAALQIAHLLP